MIIAFLFNWAAYPHNRNYWHDIRRAVFKTGVIQRSGRHMKLSIGDVLCGIERGQNPEALFNAAFANSKWQMVDNDRLNEGFPTVFGMVFENMPQGLATELDAQLILHKGYLGAISIHLELPPHLALYRLRLPPEYRVEGTKLRAFYSMGNRDGCDDADLKSMRRLGYTDIDWEDSGASRTIFDDYDTTRHFERVAAFRNILSDALAGGEDDAYQLVMLLEDLNPRLFDTLGAAAERLRDADTEEAVAQVALSGRRYMEQLADTLFPATDIKRENRVLDEAAYRNRLWAYVEDRTPDDLDYRQRLGLEIDRIVKEVNAGLHADQPKERVAAALTDAASLTANLFALDPAAIRNGYLAYSGALRSFVRELASQRSNEVSGQV
jgi:hypothetical protein